VFGYWLPGLVGLPAMLALRSNCARHEAAEAKKAHDLLHLPVPVARPILAA
jgi:hypothetical protein